MNAFDKEARRCNIEAAAIRIAARNIATQDAETLECLRTEDVRDCFNFIAESLHDETAE
jgi:hypothetical protein